jgi:hypothetical protein
MMIEHDRRQIRAAFSDCENKSALMIAESPEQDFYPLHRAFHESCASREHAIQLGFDEDAFDMSVRIHALSSPKNFLENPEQDREAIERIEYALRFAREAGLKIICSFGLNATAALSAALKQDRPLNLYHFSGFGHSKPPWIFCFDHPSPVNPIWKADSSSKTKLMFSDQANLMSRRIVRIGGTVARRNRKAAAHIDDMRARHVAYRQR